MAQTADRDVNRALRARFDDVYGQYQRLRAGLDELRQRLTAYECTVTSDDGLVKATVGPRGQLVRLTLDPRVYRPPDADALAAKITATVCAAGEEAARAVRDMVGEYVPVGTGAVDFLQDNDFGALLRRHDSALREEATRDA